MGDFPQFLAVSGFVCCCLGKRFPLRWQCQLYGLACMVDDQVVLRFLILVPRPRKLQQRSEGNGHQKQR